MTRLSQIAGFVFEAQANLQPTSKYPLICR